MVRLEHVKKTYNVGRKDETTVFEDVCLTFPQCGMIALCGKSGSGKTTILNAIGGLIKINSGNIYFEGKNVTDEEPQKRIRRVGFIFQNYYLCEEISVFDNVAAALRVEGITDDKVLAERVNTSLRNVGLLHLSNRMPQTLSGGQQQRVAIARALVKNPRVLLADEPTGNLDDCNKTIVMQLLREISRKCLVIIVTHDPEIIKRYCDGSYLVKEGRVSEYIPNTADFERYDNDTESLITIMSASHDSEKPEKKAKGKLFRWSDSLKSGWNDISRNTVGQIALRWALFAISVLLVLTTAFAWATIHECENVKSRNNNNIFYGYINDTNSAKRIEQMVDNGEAGLDGIIYCEEPIGGDRSFSLRLKEYESSLVSDWDRSVILCLHGTILPERMMTNVTGSYEKKTNLSGKEVVITTAMAEQVTKSKKLSLLSSPQDLIGFYLQGTDCLRIVDIVDSKETAVYVSNELFASMRFCYEYPAVNIIARKEATEGKVQLIRNMPLSGDENVKAGDIIFLNGMSFCISTIKDMYYPYSQWLEDFSDKRKQTQEEYISQKSCCIYEYWDYYFQDFSDYLNYCSEHRDSVYFDRCMELANEGNKYVEFYLKEEITGITDCYYASMFFEDYNRYPEENEMADCYQNYPELLTQLEVEFGQELEEHLNRITYVISSNDYLACANSFGKTEGYELRKNTKPTGYVVLHTTDSNETDKHINKWFTEYDRDGFSYMSPIQTAKERGNNISREHVVSFVFLVITLSTAMFIIYLVISSGLVKEEKNLLTFRCIGVSNQNIAFRFCIEMMVTIATTAGIGSVVTGVALLCFQTSKYGVILEEMLFYSWRICLCEVLLLLVFGVIICLGSIGWFLRKEPGDLLTEQDNK